MEQEEKEALELRKTRARFLRDPPAWSPASVRSADTTDDYCCFGASAVLRACSSSNSVESEEDGMGGMAWCARASLPSRDVKY